jgi:hypothetical protein
MRKENSGGKLPACRIDPSQAARLAAGRYGIIIPLRGELGQSSRRMTNDQASMTNE